jgi:hypothetical protein
MESCNVTLVYVSESVVGSDILTAKNSDRIQTSLLRTLKITL